MPLDNSRERRRFGRRPVFKAAVVELPDGARLAAKVIDLSDGGARIKLADPDSLDGEFQLEVPEEDLIVKCRIIHRHESWIGVEFIKSPRRLSWLRKGSRK